MHFRKTSLTIILTIALPALADAPATNLGEVVITASPMEEPLKVVTDPKAPRQPVPAHDGGDYLKTIPGFSVIRKGGTDGDPVFRGMAGSRLNILLDGEQILGGCGARMDPPTAYVFPESYDRITLLKGPQTVAYGPGNSAGTVLFERDVKRFREGGFRFNGSLTAGSFGRNDQVADFRAGNPDGYVQFTGTRSDANAYKDGDGRRVHSAYTRWSTSAALGVTPDDNTRVELTVLQSDGEAAYADRSVDGSKFARENVGLKFEKKNLSPVFEKVEAHAYYNYVDHVMDSYSMRPGNPAGMMAAMNPDRKTVGGKLAATLRLADPTQLKLGLDAQSNVHTGRMGAGVGMMHYEGQPRVEDANFGQIGLYGELTHFLGEKDRIVAGLRSDWWDAQDKRQRLALTMMGSVANPTANKRRDSTLASGFARWEHDLAAGSTAYVGLGHVERFPDFWELVYKEGPTAADLSAFATTKPEKTTQLDAGVTWKQGPLGGFVSGFYGKVNDFILIQSNVVRSNVPWGLMGNRTVSIVRNVDATTWGGEAGVNYAFTPNLRGDASLAVVRGTNDTEDRALAQIPPFEARLGLVWDNQVWSFGSLLRLVSRQNRYAVNEGNIVGQDIGRTAGFGIFSINAGYRPKKGVLLAAGIDNLFDKTYAEHISRAGAMVAGFTQTTRVNEPGRNLWLRASIAID